MKTTAIYMRVSSRAQDMAAQEPDLKRWAAAHDDGVAWYRDTFTGKSMERSGWKKEERRALGPFQEGLALEGHQ